MDLKTAPSQRDHVRGALTARVTLVEYADFGCQFCRSAYPVVRQLLHRFEGDLRVLFRHNPRGEINPQAHLAARAAEAAALQHHFWKMHDRLFEHPRGLEEPAILEYAAQLGLDPHRFASDLHSRGVAARVYEDEVSGLHNGVVGTPTFFINGAHFRGRPDFESLSSAIRDELSKLPPRDIPPDSVELGSRRDPNTAP